MPQRLEVVFQPFLSILLPEEHGVGKTWPDDTLVAFTDQIGPGRCDVGNGDEPGHQPPVGVQKRKVLLVRLHGGDECLLRNLEKALLERAGDGCGPFHQGRDLVEQVVVHLCRTTGLAGGAFHHFPYEFAPGVEVRNHMAFGPQQALVIIGADDFQRFGMVEAVSAGHAARGGVEQGAGHHGVTVQKGEPVDRADEFGIGISPPHPLGNGQTV